MMDNNPKLNHSINQFYLNYYDDSLLVHEYIIRKCGFFNALLDFKDKLKIGRAHV